MDEENKDYLELVQQQGVLVATSVRYWRGVIRLTPEDLGLKASNVDEKLIQLGHKRLVPRKELSAFGLVESRVQAAVEASGFPFLGGVARFVPNPRITRLHEELNAQEEAFLAAQATFMEQYDTIREQALEDWREAARALPGNSSILLATVSASFPPKVDVAKRFLFRVRMFQVHPDVITVEEAADAAQMADIKARKRIAEQANAQLQRDIGGFIRESVVTLREETAKLAGEVLASIDGAEHGVHQKTLNRLSKFVEEFRTLNFAGDQDLERTLEKFQTELLTRSAAEYRESSAATASLRDGLKTLRASAVAMAQADTGDVLQRFGQMGNRKLDLA